MEENGRSVTLFKVNRDPDDAGEPWRGTSTPAAPGSGGLEIPDVIIAFVPVSASESSGSGFGKLIADAAGELGSEFNQVGLLASDSLPTGVTPMNVEECDAIRDGADIWKIVSRGHLRPASTSVLFILGLTR